MNLDNFYDRAGNPITDADRFELIASDPNYKRVAETDLDHYWVSTVWLGLDHQWDDGPPLIFETMVFAKDSAGEIDFSGEDSDRYSTEAEALAGHKSAVARWRNAVPR